MPSQDLPLRIDERSATVAPMSESRPASARRFVLALVGLGVVAIVAISASAGANPRDLLAVVAWMRASGPLGALVFVLIHIVAILTFVPITPLVFVAGFIWGPFWGTVVMSIGSLFGTTGALLLGRRVLRAWVIEHFGDSAHYRAVDQAVQSAGFRAIFLLRSAPVPLAVLNYSLSLTRIGVATYASATVLGLLPLTVIYTTVGGGVAEAGAIFDGQVSVGDKAGTLVWAGTIALVLVLAWVARLARRNLRVLLQQSGQR